MTTDRLTALAHTITRIIREAGGQAVIEQRSGFPAGGRDAPYRMAQAIRNCPPPQTIEELIRLLSDHT